MSEILNYVSASGTLFGVGLIFGFFICWVTYMFDEVIQYVKQKRKLIKNE